MVSSVTWPQFITWLVTGLAVYGVITFLLFYARDVRRRLTTRAGDGAESPSAATVPPVDVMGQPRNNTSAPGADPRASCRNCGFPLSPPPPPRRGEPLLPVREIDVVVEEDNADGAVDLDDLEGYIEQATSVVERRTGGAPPRELTEVKRRLTAALAADDLLNSTDFARQVAVTLDREVPTGSYSSLAELERLAA